MINKLRSLTIRTHLTILLLLVALPSLALIVHSGLNERNEAIDGAKRDCLRLVDTIATEQQAVVAGAQQLATALALLPAIRSGNRDAANALFADLLKVNPQYANIAVCDKSGLAWASAIPAKGKVSVADRRYFQEAVRTGMFSSGEYTIGRVAAKPVMNFGYPVKDTANEQIAVIVVALDLNHTQRIFDKISLPPGASFSLLDHQGIILIRNLKDTFSEKLVGRRDFREDNFTPAKEGPAEGTFEAVGNDGKPRLVAYKRISLPHESKPYLYIRSSIPLASVTAKANGAMLKNLALLLLLFGAAIVIVYFIGKRVIVNPVMLLQNASEQLAAGAGTVNVSHLVKGGELGALARAFDGMAEAVVQRGRAMDVAQAALRESEERWATTLASIGDAVIATDGAGQINFINPVAQDLTGWQRKEALGQPVRGVFRIINEESREPGEDIVARVLKEGSVVALANHTALVTRDGREVPVEDSAAPIKNRAGNVIGVVLVFHDVTEKRRARTALQESEKRLRRLYESGLLGIVFWNMNGEITDANDKFLEMVGYDREDLGAGRIDWNRMTPPEYRHLDEHSAEELKATGVNKQPFEKAYIRKDGTRIPIIVAGAMLDEVHFNGIAVVLDITQRKRAEQDLAAHATRLEEINEELESFSFSISHDLRAPLRAIKGFSRMILKKQGEGFDEETRHRFQTITDNAETMGRLLDDMLDFSHLTRQDVAKGSIDMQELIGEAWQKLLMSHPRREMTLKIGDMPAAWGDRPLIRQVYDNLLGNAVKFTQEREAPVIETGCYVQNFETVYYVRDNGVGFDMRFYDKLFGVYQHLHAADYEGRGIGLALVRRIIHRHGGQVWAEGKVGEGATFYFTLPV